VGPLLQCFVPGAEASCFSCTNSIAEVRRCSPGPSDYRPAAAVNA
jgi:hypothetical protein